jgi:hypothetical protein
VTADERPDETGVGVERSGDHDLDARRHGPSACLLNETPTAAPRAR